VCVEERATPVCSIGRARQARLSEHAHGTKLNCHKVNCHKEPSVIKKKSVIRKNSHKEKPVIRKNQS
jgi:hypothetical protein